MSAISMAWDWNIPPDIGKDQPTAMQIDIPIPQIPDMKAGEKATEKDNRLAASLQNEEDQILQRKREAKIAKKSDKSLINYQAIQTILKTEMEAEIDKDIQATILKQLELLEAILEFKYLDKKDKLNIKLQKQVQELIPVQTQVQKQKQVKTYAETLQTGIQEKNSQNIKFKTQQKQKEVKKYKEKRLIIQITQEEVAKLNSYHLQNQINDKFFQKEGIAKPVVATVTKSFTGLSIILTTMPDFTADFLIQKKAV